MRKIESDFYEKVEGLNMRFVPTFCLREGMLMGDNLYGENGELLLAKETVLKIDYIEGINKLKYTGVYIEDDISSDIPILKTISEKVRSHTLKGIKDIFIKTDNRTSPSRTKYKDMEKQIENIVDEILENQNMMVNMLDLKVFDDYTYFHSVNVAVLSIVLGTALGLRRSSLCELGFEALLHDIGKVFVSKHILNKQGPLTESEFKEMKRHSLLGYQHLKNEVKYNSSSQLGVLEHHEKFNGEGYPYGIQGDEISLFGRIISVTDVYDALTSDRPYRKGLMPSEAIEYLMGCIDTLFDPELVNVFITKIAPYPVGTCVLLSNGMVGIVSENFSDYCLRPNIRIFKVGDQRVTPYEISLSGSHCLNITVVGFAQEE